MAVKPAGFAVLFSLLTGCADNNQSPTPREYPEMESTQAQLYIDKCGQCHAAPSPNTHPANIWPGVVERMQLRMKTKHVPPLNREEVAIVLEYLQAHAKPADTNH
jgi:hypothetical protein